MIILLHGSDTFTSHEKFIATRERFAASHGVESIIVRTGNEVPVGTVRDRVKQIPLWSDKHMVILENFFISKPSADRLKEMRALLPDVPEHTVLLFYESAPVTKTSLQIFPKDIHCEECTALTPASVRKWIEKRALDMKTRITPEATAALVEAAGTDLWRMSHELEKLSLFAHTSPITEEMVALLVASDVQSNIFHLVDLIGQRDMKRAVTELTNLRATGTDPMYILAMIVYHFRIVIQARDMLNRGKGKTEFIQTAHVYPFVAEKSLAEAKRFTLPQLTALYARLAWIDRDVKRGLIDINVALDHFIFETVNNS